MAANNCKPLPPFTKHDIARFWSRIDVQSKTACWVWRAGFFNSGYGCFRVTGKSYVANRIAYFLTFDKDPLDSHVCHSCDIRYPIGDIAYRKCCNPGHLWLGTSADNIQDASNKGRMATGDRNGSRLYPERLPRGDLSPVRQHPELIIRGERHHWSKITPQQVSEIRALYQTGTTKRSIARAVGVSMTQTCRIISRQSHSHLP